jgi:hypothetical protein
LEKRGEVAYQLELLSQLSDVHEVFHVSQLKKCLHVPEEQLPMEDLDVKEDLSYQEYPIDEDINTLATIIPSIEIVGPITRSRAQQLNH